MPCQSGRSAVSHIKALGGSIVLAVAAPAVAGSASWAHQAGSLSSNGAVTVKSLSGGSTAGTLNPTGAVAKANQVAATQPPTVIIQATSSAQPFNYKDDCYLFRVGSGSYEMLGLGKLDASNKFTGVLATRTSAAAAYLLGTSLGGASPQNTTNLTPIYVGADGDAFASSISDRIAIAVSMPTVTVTPIKCYP